MARNRHRTVERQLEAAPVAILEMARIIATAMGDIVSVEALDGAAEGGYQYHIEVTED